ncbi:hypothetical protein BH09SUM1_BH09SUM1_11180 [soil metagenome]
MIRRRAFTLIELLIVVSIIAILAALAIPNLLEAQTRAKVARVKAEFRTIATALATYQVDYNCYPIAPLVPPSVRLRPLTTPVAYITSVPRDIFAGEFAEGGYHYGAMGVDKPSRWAISSFGPDRLFDTLDIQFYPGYTPGLFAGADPNFDWRIYDPTNGSISRGDVFRASDYTPR